MYGYQYPFWCKLTSPGEKFQYPEVPELEIHWLVSEERAVAGFVA